MGDGDTIVALSSGRPPAAVAIVRTSGPHSFAAGERIVGALPPMRRVSLRRLIDPLDGGLIDEALLLRFDAPNSATGENIVEYQCHGGRATVDALVAALCREPGIRLAEPGEFTRRALANGRIDLTEAEGLADLLAAETELQRRSAVGRAGGALRWRLDDWRERLLGLAARAEVAIDYADEADGESEYDLVPDIEALAAEMGLLLSAPRVEPLRDGIRVVAAGPPNAGKSSLINALAQADRAIVTPVAGTTRDVIEVPLAIGGVPFVLIDTAGMRDAIDEVEAIGVSRARSEQANADIILWLGEVEARPHHPRLIQLHPKSDLGGEIAAEALPVSTITGDGLAQLTDSILAAATTLLPQGDQLSLDRRQFELLDQAREALRRAANVRDHVLVAEDLRTARDAVDRIGGRAGVEELLDQLFARFCLGK